MPLQNTTPATFAQDVLNSARPVLVDFWAPWCGPCKDMEKTLEDLAAARPDVAVVRLNVEDHPSAMAAFGIDALPTFMLFRGGNILMGATGPATLAELGDKIDERLASADPGITLQDYSTVIEKEKADRAAPLQQAMARVEAIMGAGLKTAGGLTALFMAVTTGMVAAGAVATVFNAVRGVSLYRNKGGAPDLQASFSGKAFSTIANAANIASGAVLISTAVAATGFFVTAGLGLAGGFMLATGGKGLWRDALSFRPRP